MISDEKLLAGLALLSLAAIAIMLLLDAPPAALGARCWIVGHWERMPNGALACVVR